MKEPLPIGITQAGIFSLCHIIEHNPWKSRQDDSWSLRIYLPSYQSLWPDDTSVQIMKYWMVIEEVTENILRSEVESEDNISSIVLSAIFSRVIFLPSLNIRNISLRSE